MLDFQCKPHASTELREFFKLKAIKCIDSRFSQIHVVTFAVACLIVIKVLQSRKAIHYKVIKGTSFADLKIRMFTVLPFLFVKEVEISRTYRDTRALSIAGGADEVMLGIICKLSGTLP